MASCGFDRESDVDDDDGLAGRNGDDRRHSNGASLAYALEWPGKMRLSRERYVAVQPIYYPGFTIGGAAEPIGIALLLALLLFTSADSVEFWLTAAAFAALAGAHAAYWLVTHPVNNFWLKDVQLRGGGTGFFAFDPLRRNGHADTSDWTRLARPLGIVPRCAGGAEPGELGSTARRPGLADASGPMTATGYKAQCRRLPRQWPRR